MVKKKQIETQFRDFFVPLHVLEIIDILEVNETANCSVMVATVTKYSVIEHSLWASQKERNNFYILNHNRLGFLKLKIKTSAL